MSRDQRLLGFLLRGVSHEMGAAQHYLMQAALAELWGEEAFALHLREDVREELGHADALMRRLLAYGVTPGASQLFPVRLGCSVAELIAANREVELAAVRLYEEAVAYCRRTRNATDEQLFATLLAEEARHLSDLEAWPGPGSAGADTAEAVGDAA